MEKKTNTSLKVKTTKEILKEELEYFENNFNNQLNSNEKIDKIIIWIIGFVFATLGLIFSKIDKIHIDHYSIWLFIFLIPSIISALASRVFSYYFNLSFAINLNYLRKKITEEETNLFIKKSRKEILLQLEEDIPLLKLKGKERTRKNIFINKSIFVWASFSTLLFFLVSISIFLYNLLSL